MKDRRGIFLLIAFTLMGSFMLISFFILNNYRDSSVHAPSFSLPETDAYTIQIDTKVPTELLNINTATAEQLQTLPGIGPVLAQRILIYRSENGPFMTLAELTKVKGIGNSRLATLLGYITLGG